MKNRYYGSFVPGAQETIAAVVRERLPDVSILKLLDGAILFETECAYDKLNFFCFNNIFAVIDVLNARAGDPAGILESHIKKFLAEKAGRAGGAFPEKGLAAISENNKKIKTFRLVCSLENKPASIDGAVKSGVEKFIARNSALKVDRSGPDTEFWFLYRREGFSLFMKRLTRSVEKRLHPGELSPQLAWLLCKIGELKPGETVIDPFCGYGSIPEAALKHFHIKKMFAADLDPRCVKIARERRSVKNGRCEIYCGDIFSAPGFFPSGEADAIVSDPPWGMYKATSVPLEEFYRNALAVFSGFLKPSGRAAALIGARKEFEAAAEKEGSFAISEIIPVLVSGKKAAVYAMKKTAAPVSGREGPAERICPGSAD